MAGKFEFTAQDADTLYQTNRRQRGVTLLVLLLVLVLGLGTLLINSTISAQQYSVRRDRDTAMAMAKAKEALIAWSVTRGDEGTYTNSRPGDLPCPDTSAPGTIGYGSEEGACAAGKIGRLPWKTLGIDELKDADGEPLWYAVSGNFRKSASAPINSDTQGTLVLYDRDGSTPLSPPGEELAAVILAPGLPLGTQNRVSDPTAAANYLDLDTASGKNNAVIGGPFIAGPVKDGSGNTTVNDRVVSISARELIAAAELRVLKEAGNLLTAYALSHGGKYPNPAPNTCVLVPSPANFITTTNYCVSDASRCFGRLPEDVFLPPVAPSWFVANGWGRVLPYAVQKNFALDGSGVDCTNSLTVDGVGKTYVLFSPGTPLASQTRPTSGISNYLETSGDLFFWTTADPGQGTLVTPPAITKASNDRLRSLP